MRPLPLGTDPLALCARWPERYPFLLQSVAWGTAQARYDVLPVPDGESLVLASDGRVLANGQALEKPFLTALNEWHAALGPLEGPVPAPFGGGWFVYLGYELAGEIEPRLELPAAGGGLPVAFASRCTAAVIVDHAAEQVWAVAEPGALGLLDRLDEDWRTAGEVRADPPGLKGAVREEDPQRFREALARIHRYILDGDVFQVNISRRWDVAGDLSPVAAYAALRRHNPAPFAALARWQDAAVVSSSPERLVRTRGRQVETRPIAGTRPRDEVADEHRRQELLGHPKERAEHIMLIDLERNDLGRVCRPGSVEVDELMVVESYAHVHHIVSNVRGRLRDDVQPGDVIRALFPGGTITGCPKVRCMEIIAELEGEGRGPYTGALGYLNRDGSLDLNILIRTLELMPGGLRFRAGAGIVADSQADHELEETRSKAKGLLLALGGDRVPA